jgi:hypothetical protein
MPLSSLANTQRRQQQPGDVLRFRDAGSTSLLVTNPAVNFLGNQMVDGSRERNQENITSSSSGILTGPVQWMLRMISTEADTQPRKHGVKLKFDVL